MRKAKQAPKAKHYQLRWNVFHAVDVVEEFHNDTCLDAWAVANCLVRGKA